MTDSKNYPINADIGKKLAMSANKVMDKIYLNALTNVGSSELYNKEIKNIYCEGYSQGIINA